MADRNPGTPLHPEQVAGAQGLPMGNFVVPSHAIYPGNGQYHTDIPVLLPVPIQHAQYNAHNVPFTPQKTDYKP